MDLLLKGIVGSTAYGLARPGSDVDYLGLFAADTPDLVGLHQPEETIVAKDPDYTRHEARKFCTLAMSCNPTVSELLWLPDDLYEIRTPLGDYLVNIRRAFLSAHRVRNAYLGYATQQFKRLEGRGGTSFSADTQNRTAKHARHLRRLCFQGLELYRTGVLQIRLDDPQTYIDFGDRVEAGDIDAARAMIAEYEEAFDSVTTVLPAAPDEAQIGRWLRTVRREHWYERSALEP